MGNFDKVARALNHIDNHLDENLDYKQIADTFHFSPYYFHRLFTAIVGKPIAAYIRDRRLIKACKLLTDTNKSIISICFDCGFDSSQAFSRTFKNNYGISPSDYRNFGYRPVEVSVEELIIRFTNRLKGGILVTPKIIKKDALLIAGVTGDGDNTAGLWQHFMELNKSIGMINKLSDNGFEIRIYADNICKCHVGIPISDRDANNAYSLLQLPATKYASFDVYVSRGYDSENSAINEWLETNKGRYSQKMYDGKPYIVEFYDERFNGNNEDSIIEIWIPIEDSIKT